MNNSILTEAMNPETVVVVGAKYVQSPTDGLVNAIANCAELGGCRSLAAITLKRSCEHVLTLRKQLHEGMWDKSFKIQNIEKCSKIVSLYYSCNYRQNYFYKFIPNPNTVH